MLGSAKPVFMITLTMYWVALGAPVVAASGAEENTFQKEVQEDIRWKLGYDEEGRVNQVVDPGGKETTFEYTLEEADG